ncbi:MAG TPA: hypothetical protein VNW29_00780 [Candidatus Sulfotelmatobacter sp.]|jgi:flagellar basal body-associated protein FliL|nr:hypothetical protein [Candidatus Sulfotelmatobacter sp.]
MDQQQGATQSPQPIQPAQPSPVTNIPAQTAPSDGATPKSGKSKSIYIIFGIILLIIIAAGFFYFTKHTNKPFTMKQPAVQTTPIASKQIAPTITPVTAGNVDQTLNNSDASMQQAVSQANTDLTSVNSINLSQDSTNGL